MKNTTPHKLPALLFCALVALCFGGCTTTKTTFPIGPRPELVINSPAASLRRAIIADMVRSGYSLSAETDHMVRFYRAAPAEGATGLAYLTSAVTGFGRRKDAQHLVTYTLTETEDGRNKVTVSAMLLGEGIEQEMTGDEPTFNFYIAQLRTIRDRLEKSNTPPPTPATS